MDLSESREQQAFRSEARRFLGAASGTLFQGISPASWCPGDDSTVRDLVDRCRRWQLIKHDAGWAGISWPRRYGGRGGTEAESLIFGQEEAAIVTPWLSQLLGLGMAGPALLAHGSEPQRRRHLRSMLQGQSVWCQLFSEPDAGSDLFSLRTKARRTSSGRWVVNGQKLWSSRANLADFGLLLARSHPDLRKGRGLTLFVLPMQAPGVTCHPIRQLNGGREFCEVVLEDVELSDADIVGEPAGGAIAARTVLAGERADAGTITGVAISTDELAQLGSDRGRVLDATQRQLLAGFHTRSRLIEFAGLRARTSIERGDPLGPETSLLKLALSRHATAASEAITALAGAHLLLSGPSAPDAGRWTNHVLEHLAQRIGGGTDEIQMTTVAEKMLGLPR